MSLFEAVAAGDAAQVEALLAAGEHPDPFDSEGCTPLMRAAEAGNEALVKLLMEKGADPTLENKAGETALQMAAGRGHMTVSELLMPYAKEHEQDLARTLLRTSALPGGMLPKPPPASEPKQGGWMRKVASAGAWVSNKLGNEAPAKRMERLERAEKERGKP